MRLSTGNIGVVRASGEEVGILSPRSGAGQREGKNKEPLTDSGSSTT